MKFIKSTLLLGAALLAKEPMKIVHAELQGSKISIVEPATWNKKILIYAHGRAPESEPLNNEIDLDENFYNDLVDQGWIFAATSYRRNGIIIRDAVEDIENLRKYLITTYGQPEGIYLYGFSMGGKIVTHLAENSNGNYKAALALSAWLDGKDIENPLSLTFKPQIPILFLCNNNEKKRGPYDYPAQGENLKPIFWTIDRPGHGNIGTLEHKEAFNALINYAKTGKIEENKKILINVNLDKSDARFEGNTIFIKVKGSVDLICNLNISDLEQIGLKKGEYFEVGFKNKSYKSFWGDNTYDNVPDGNWVGFFVPNGGFKVTRKYENAAKRLECKEDDEIFIKPISFKNRELNEAADKLSGEAWELIINMDFSQAKEKILQALAIDALNIVALVNLTHVYIFTGELDKALELVKKYKGYRSGNGQYYYDDAITEDLDFLKEEGMIHENTKKIQEALQ